MNRALCVRFPLLIAVTLALLAALLLPSGTTPAQAQPIGGTGSYAVVVDPVSVTGTMTPASPAALGDTVTVSYDLPPAGNAASAVQDLASNDLAGNNANSFGERPVVNHPLQGRGVPRPGGRIAS